MEMIKNDLGYTKNMKSLVAERILKVLNKNIRYNNVTISRIDFVVLFILNKRVPSIEENFSYYSKKLEGNTKPKTIYTLSSNVGSFIELFNIFS